MPYRDSKDMMRQYMNLFEFEETVVSEPSNHELTPSVPVGDRLSEILFKLRSYTEPTGGDYSMGFESGLAMAADMIENVIKAMGDQSGS